MQSNVRILNSTETVDLIESFAERLVGKDRFFIAAELLTLFHKGREQGLEAGLAALTRYAKQESA